MEEEAKIKITCDKPIFVHSGFTDYHHDHDGYHVYGRLGDGESLGVTVDVEEAPATCWATERIIQTGVEQDASDCAPRQLTPGSIETCTITNTVFFEGIPTLSQYGLALLTLLTLGVGLIAFRRFV